MPEEIRITSKFFYLFRCVIKDFIPGIIPILLIILSSYLSEKFPSLIALSTYYL
jgi:hypothetical protein